MVSAVEQDSLEDYLQLLLPVLLRMLEKRDVKLEVRSVALRVILELTADSNYLLDSSSRLFGGGNIRRGEVTLDGGVSVNWGRSYCGSER